MAYRRKKTYQCENSKETFSNLYDFKSHKRIHTGEKQFELNHFKNPTYYECKTCIRTSKVSKMII